MVHWTNTLFGPSPVFLSNSKQSIHKHVQIIIFVAQHFPLDAKHDSLFSEIA